MRQLIGNLPVRFWIFNIVDSFGYSCIHAFYPNMPKFFQEKFNFTNTEAGVICSLPYLIASLSVPVFGTLLRRANDTKLYEVWLLYSLLSLFGTHTSYLVMPEHISVKWLPVTPLIVFGLSHALFTTLISPIVPSLIDNNAELLPICFSIMKIVEGIFITLFT